MVEFAREINDHDIANARRGVDELRTLIRKLSGKTDVVVVQTDAGTVTLEIDALRSLAKVVEFVSAHHGHDPNADTDEEISPQQAAELLRMSRPSVMRLIEKGHLTARKVNTHHRLSRAEVLAYAQTQARVRREGLTEIAKISEEYDF